MKRTSAELQMTPLTVHLPAYKIAQLRQLAEQTNAKSIVECGISYNVAAETVAVAILIQELDRITQEPAS